VVALERRNHLLGLSSDLSDIDKAYGLVGHLPIMYVGRHLVLIWRRR
jgi:hypothetical protein